MNLPNKITLARIGLTFVFMFFLFSKGVLSKSLALATFIMAAFSDYLDGFVARHYGLKSNFGKLMDPIADKVLTLAAFLAFVEMKLVPAWMVVIIIMRELVITGLRLMAAGNNTVLHAGRGGKHKTVSQMVSIVVILVFIIVNEAGISIQWYRPVIFYMMLITVALTIGSGISYIVGNKKYFFNGKHE